MNSRFTLYVATGLITFYWIFGHFFCSQKMRLEKKLQIQWILKASLIFLAYLALLLFIGNNGLITNFEKFPPPFMGFFVLLIFMSYYLAFSKFGTAFIEHIPLHMFIGFQFFRALAELALYQGLQEGLAPIQLTFEGYNFDFITALTALPLAWYVYKTKNLKVALLWNYMGLAFLSVIAFIAITSMPTPLRLFMNEPSNIWVTRTPYILLPGILVMAAFATHILAIRKIKLLTTKR